MHRRAAWRVIERPLPREEKAFAQLRLWCDPRRLDEEDLPLLDSLLPHLAASLERALLDREARQDPLTGVAVRRVLERRLQEVYARILEEGGLMAVLMCDLDHFKRINDRWGHGTGDRALQAAARAFESALRSKPSGKDLLARYGGEEFTVLLDGTGGEEALAVGERLRRAVDVLDFRDEEGGTAIPLSASVGVAAFPELHIKTATELLLLADGALYEAKRQGRNQCLLGLGRGRYRRGDGELVTGSELPQQTSLPNFFS
jgi:diguanylate cyclase (GGDEF)-like protein